MIDATAARQDLHQRIDAIESAYEFTLAYAAQGLPSDRQASSGSQLRESLDRFDAALSGLAELYEQLLAAERPDHAEAYQSFLDVLAQDAHAAQAALRVVRTQPDISSQLVDNLNASIHVRALLTDVFLIDEAVKQGSLRS